MFLGMASIKESFCPPKYLYSPHRAPKSTPNKNKVVWFTRNSCGLPKMCGSCSCTLFGAMELLERFDELLRQFSIWVAERIDIPENFVENFQTFMCYSCLGYLYIILPWLHDFLTWLLNRDYREEEGDRIAHRG